MSSTKYLNLFPLANKVQKKINKMSYLVNLILNQTKYMGYLGIWSSIIERKGTIYWAVSIVYFRYLNFLLILYIIKVYLIKAPIINYV